MRRPLGWLLGVALCWTTAAAQADELKLAVAANFAQTAEALAPLFQQKTGHTIVTSVGASGALYAQIQHGAPFDVFLSADTERPKLLEKEGLAMAGTRFVYARGKLVLWSPAPGVVDAQGAILKRPDLGKLAVADPATAPYGAAAREVLSRLGLWEPLSSAATIVIGTSVAQVFQFAASGNVRCAFLAWSQVLSQGGKGSLWKVPQALYTPLDQEAILLKPGAESAAARAFLRFLAQDQSALAVLRKAGYETPKR